MSTPQGPSSAELLIRGIWRENPVLVTTLGLCPTLAVTNSVANSLTMGIATMCVLTCSSLLVSSVRKVVPNQVRISTFILIIATFVTLADMVLEAIVPAIHKALGAFIALIVVNCIILGRQEAFASKNGPARSALDALGVGAGFTLTLLVARWWFSRAFLTAPNHVTVERLTEEVEALRQEIDDLRAERDTGRSHDRRISILPADGLDSARLRLSDENAARNQAIVNLSGELIRLLVAQAGTGLLTRLLTPGKRQRY